MAHVVPGCVPLNLFGGPGSIDASQVAGARAIRIDMEDSPLVDVTLRSYRRLREAGFGIHYEDVRLTQVLGYAALVLILIEGGLTTRWSGIRRSVAACARTFPTIISGCRTRRAATSSRPATSAGCGHGRRS